MPKKKSHDNLHHVLHSSKKHSHPFEQGYINSEAKGKMNKNERIIMVLLVIGIIVFLALSLLVLFRKANKSSVSNFPTSTLAPTSKLNTTPYPTIPPVKNMTVMLNTRMFNPSSFSIPAGGTVDFLNIDNAPISLVGTDSNSQMLNLGPIVSGDDKMVKFDKPGVYKYQNKDDKTEVGEITIK